MPGPVPLLAVGEVRQISVDGEAQVKVGFSPDLIPVAAASWGSPFRAEVANSYALVGRRVLLAFPDGQPLILMTIGA